MFTVSNIHIKGIATCVPEHVVEIKNIPLFHENEAEVFSKNTGIFEKHVADEGICASDLCYQAAQNVIEKLAWNKEDIKVLIFVSQTPDYILPATSNLLQHRLGLPNDCFCLDISLGCSGYIYGLSAIANFLQNPQFKKGLLLVGDTISQYTSDEDKSVYPLFGDAGTATAIEFDDSINSKWSFITGTDGSGENAIKIVSGGSRNKFNAASLEKKPIENNATGRRSDVDLILDGMEVFNFAIKTAPKLIDQLISDIQLEKESLDYLFLHQANLFMNETIRKKLKIDASKTPNSLSKYGNTNGASIPVTISHYFNNENLPKDKEVILCGFGVGLSWGAVHFKTSYDIKTSISIYEQ